MQTEKSDTPTIGEATTGKQQDIPSDSSQTGRDIPFETNTPSTFISDDSKNDIAEQDHQGSDNKPNGGRV